MIRNSSNMKRSFVINFDGNNLLNVQSHGEDCGTCWMKKGNISREHAIENGLLCNRQNKQFIFF